MNVTQQIARLLERPWLLFLGAGASVPCGLKDWKGLAGAAIRLGRECGLPPETLSYAQGSVDRGRLDLVFDAIREELPPGRWTNWLREETTPSRGFGDLHLILFNLRPHGVLTTNYDTIAEGAFSQVLGRGPTQLDNDSQGLLAVQAATDFVCHFHGMIEGGGTLVLGAQSYRQFYEGSILPRDCIRQLLLRYNVLYIGFGHGDLDLEYLFKGALERLNPSTYALSLVCSERYSDALAERLRRVNTGVVRYDRIDSEHTGLVLRQSSIDG